MRITTIFLLTVIMLIISALSGNGFSQENQGTTAPMPERFSKFNDPVFGSNVFVFHDNMEMKEIQEVIDTVFFRQSARGSEFTTNRYSLFFMPGSSVWIFGEVISPRFSGLGLFPGAFVLTGVLGQIHSTQKAVR